MPAAHSNAKPPDDDAPKKMETQNDGDPQVLDVKPNAGASAGVDENAQPNTEDLGANGPNVKVGLPPQISTLNEGPPPADSVEAAPTGKEAKRGVKKHYVCDGSSGDGVAAEVQRARTQLVKDHQVDWNAIKTKGSYSEGLVEVYLD